VTCMTALAQPMAMATTELARVIRYDISAPRQEQNTGHTPRELGCGHRQGRQPRAPHAMGGRGRLLRANKEMKRGEQE
jgi:hypothetical protein